MNLKIVWLGYFTDAAQFQFASINYMPSLKTSARNEQCFVLPAVILCIADLSAFMLTADLSDFFINYNYIDCRLKWFFINYNYIDCRLKWFFY